MNRRFAGAVIILLAAGMIGALWVVKKQRTLIAELQQVQISTEDGNAESDEVEAPAPLPLEPQFVEVMEPPFQLPYNRQRMRNLKNSRLRMNG